MKADKKDFAQPVNIVPTTLVHKKVLIIAVALFAIVVLSGFLFLLTRNLAWTNNSSGQKVVDIAKLEREYQTQFRAILNGYLTGYDNSGQALGEEFLNQTRRTENEILALVVPTKSPSHLMAAQALGQIVVAAQTNDVATVTARIDSLRNLLK